MTSIFSSNFNTINATSTFGGTLFNNIGSGSYGSTSGLFSGNTYGSSGLFGSNFGYGGYGYFGNTFGSYFGNSWGGLGSIWGSTTTPVITTPDDTVTRTTGTTITTVQTDEEQNLSFLAEDFAYLDGEVAASLQIVDLPDHGTLEVDGHEVSVNELISVDEFDNMDYIPDDDFDGIDTFSVKLSEDGVTYDSSNSIIQINVTNENDAPELGTISTISVVEGETSTGVGASIAAAFSDVDSDDYLDEVKIKFEDGDHGKLTYDSDFGSKISIEEGETDTLSAEELATLEFVADSDVAGSSDAVVKLEVEAFDSEGSDSNTEEMTIKVTDGNDAPAFSSSSKTYTTVENSTTIAGMAANPATDEESNALLTYTISGTDSGFFNVNSANGYITFTDNPDYEDHQDSDIDGVYELSLTATDPQGETAVQALKVTVTNDTQILGLSSLAATVNVAENDRAVTQVVASTDDPSNTIAYSISGTDADLFDIDESDGTLTFISAPDAEDPEDAGADNVYDITVNVSDEYGEVADVSKNLKIKVTEVDDEDAEFESASAPSSGAPSASVYSLVSTIEDKLEVELQEGHTTTSAQNLIALSFSNGEANLTGQTANLSFDIESSAGTSNFTLSTYSGTTTDPASVIVQYSASSSSALDHEDEDEITLTIVANDNEGTSAQTDVLVTVLDKNESPEYDAPARHAVAIGGTLPIGDAILNSMTDPEDDDLTFQLFGIATDPETTNIPGGRFEYDWTGNGNFVNYTPNPEAPELSELEVQSLRFVEDDNHDGIVKLYFQAVDDDGSQIATTDATLEILIF